MFESPVAFETKVRTPTHGVLKSQRLLSLHNSIGPQRRLKCMSKGGALPLSAHTFVADQGAIFGCFISLIRDVKIVRGFNGTLRPNEQPPQRVL